MNSPTPAALHRRYDAKRPILPATTLLATAMLSLHVQPAHAQSVDDLRAMSIEDLANIQVSSVSKAAEPLSDAPAAIYVISHDDVERSGTTTLPEMLRLAPNLEVAQLTPSSYAISARGFNVGDNASLSNKLLVMIDGRSVYTPLFGGVYWDMQSVLPQDIDRIEVISGPGATLWGANAVNGVINIITRNSGDGTGGTFTLGGGNQEQMASLQYAGRLDDDLTYRVHAEGFNFDEFKSTTGRGADDAWSKPQGGFRLDWKPAPEDTVMFQGDIYASPQDPAGFVSGRDLVANWQHQFTDGSNLQLLTYYDQANRSSDNGGPALYVSTYDIELQHSFTAFGWNNIVWGAGERSISYNFRNTALQLVPDSRTLNLANVFGQDTIALDDRLKVTVGIKLEDEPYAGLQVMPSVRASWKAFDSTLLWGAISRAVRSPTPIDEDLREFAGPIDFLNGSRDFRPEILTAYEIGTRVQASPRLSFSISSFYNVYDDLRTIEVSGAPNGLPLSFANTMSGLIYGVEMWGSYRVADWWKLSAGFNIQHEHLRFDPGSSGVGGLAFAADDPNRQASLRSSFNIGDKVTFDVDFRYVGALPHPYVSDYGEMNLRLGWKVTDTVDFSVSGFNLLHAQHLEFFQDGQTDEIPRSFFVETRWRF